MASRIESDSPSKALRRQAEQKATPPVPAKPPAPGSPPKPIPKRGPEAVEQPEQEPAEDQETRPAGRGLLGQIPAWGISMLVHIVVLLAMALMVGESSQVEKPTVITSSTSEEEEISEFEEPSETPVEIPAVADPVAEVMVTTEVVVTPITVAAVADDMEPAPLAVELTEFGSETALASDMMATSGAVGGKGGGLGGRANPAQQAIRGGGGADTEAAVDRALKWLAMHQMPDGGWDFDLAKCPSCMGKCANGEKRDDRCGATSLALLPFLGRGYTHREGPYKKQVEKGIGFLVARAIAGKGKAYDAHGSLYSQGVAGIALSECYAMSQDDQLAAPTQAVLDFIMAAQDPKGGGWRYSPREPGDTSASVWQIMALKSGNMAYLRIDPLTIKKAIEFLDSMQGDENGATYGYDNPGKGAGTSAVGLLCRMYLGWKKDHQGIQEGTMLIAKKGPTSDLYYSYYATQIMHHMQGEMWIAWNNKMKKMLLESQSAKDHEAGSWFEGVSDGHGGHLAGRLYCTALATMILEVYYRHLPIYGTQSVTESFRD